MYVWALTVGFVYWMRCKYKEYLKVKGYFLCTLVICRIGGTTVSKFGKLSFYFVYLA